MNVLAIFSSPCGLNGAAINLGFTVRALARRGHKVHVLCRRRDEAAEYLEQCGAQAIFFNLPLGMNTSHLLEVSHPAFRTTIIQNIKDVFRVFIGFPLMLRLLRTIRPDVLFLMDITFPQCALAGFLMRIPVVCEAQAELIRGWIGIRRHLLIALLSRCDRMFGITARHVAPFSVKWRNPAHFQVIPNSVIFPDAFPMDWPDVLRNTTNRELLLFVGGVTQYKGGVFALTLIKELVARRPSVLLLIAGGGDLQSDSGFDFIRSNGLEAHVRRVGVRPDILSIMVRCQVLWVPHSMPHFSRPIIEAFAVKTPVVASRDEFNEELIENGVNGFLAKYGDTKGWLEATLRLLDDKSCVTQMTQRAYEVFQSKFNPQVVEARLVDLFESLIPAQKPLGRFPVLTTRISAVTLAETVAIIVGWIARRDRYYVNVCNADVVLQAHDDPRLAAVINASGLATPDGMPLVWLGRWRGLSVGRVYGPDLMLALCESGLKLGWRHYFYGGTPEVLEDLTRRLTERFPGLQIAGNWAPPFRPLTQEEEAGVEARINAARPDVIWVGIGTPKQDFWMERFRPRLEAPVMIAVGAAFNFHAGHVRQAPRWMMRCGLEWLFRLLMEPVRLWRRYLIGVPRFVWLVLRSRDSKYR